MFLVLLKLLKKLTKWYKTRSPRKKTYNKMKTKLVGTIFRGSASVDPRFSAPMLKYIIADIKNRKSCSKVWKIKSIAKILYFRSIYHTNSSWGGLGNHLRGKINSRQYEPYNISYFNYCFSLRQLSICIEDGVLESYNTDFELQFKHQIKNIIGMCL